MANLKSVLKCWTEFNLPDLQKNLDQTASETAQRQDEAETGKKVLIELTRDWRKNTDEDARSKCSTIIKAFQKEIDTLNKRSKAAENAFLLLYKRFLEIPDPVPALKKAEVLQKQLQKTKDLEMENENLRETLNEYHNEFAEVKNQEVTLNKMKGKIKDYEDKMDAQLKIKLEEKEKILRKEFEDREQQLLDSKLNVAKKLGDSEARIKYLSEELDKSRQEIFDLKTKHEEELMGRVSEINMLEMDLERANQSALSVEKYTDSLKTHISGENNLNISGNASKEADIELIKSLEFQLSSKERELSQLMEEVHHLQATNSRNKDKYENEVNALELNLEERNMFIGNLENKLNEQEDYDEIKRELNVLKMIEFGSKQDEQTGYDSKPLEKLLMDKNKTLMSECTLLKVQNADLTVKYEELQRNASEAFRTLKEQKELITQLEGDVLNIRGLPSSVFRGEGVGAPSSSSPASADTELMSKAVSQIDGVREEDGQLDKETSDSLLPIIASQRERFRTRNLELETQSRHQQQQITSLQNDADTVRKDNVKLYEKIKFLQSYPAKGGSAAVTMDDDSVKRYSNQYEQGIDPFALFSRKEKQQRYVNLSAPEKVTLNMGRFILSNKIARTLVFFYTIMLHLLVFVVLYKFAFNEISCTSGPSSMLQSGLSRGGVTREPVPGFQPGKHPK